MSHSTEPLISDVGLCRQVWIPLFVILGLSALLAVTPTPLEVGLSVLALVLLSAAGAAASRVQVTVRRVGLLMGGPTVEAEGDNLSL